jgi:hypothetical protein
MKLFEILTTLTGKNDEKFEEPSDVDVTNKLPNSEMPEVPILPNNNVTYAIDFNSQFASIKEMILGYREVASNHRVKTAITEIVNEAIVEEDSKNTVSLNLDNADVSDSTKKKITKEFKTILNILEFKRKGYEYFEEWYIDGRLWIQLLFYDNPNKGIAAVNKLSPLDITRVKDEDGKTWFIYKEDERNRAKRQQTFGTMHDRRFAEGVKISPKNIVFVPSGLMDPENKFYISHLQSAVKPLNQLRLLEDSAVIYRITRAPERRVFYIDVGKLVKTKAENYMKSLMSRFKSTVTYDVTTGKVTNSKKVMTMLEDFYLPTRADAKGTKIETLPGGQQLGEIEDLKYFKKELLSSLQVPIQRLDADDAALVEIGRPGELSRPELTFQKFIGRLRSDFKKLFHEMLRVQLISKKIIGSKDWQSIRNDINYVWATDSYFTELKENEIMSGRLDMLDGISEHIGVYFSRDWVRKNVLRMTDDDIEVMQKEIDSERESEKDAGEEPESEF